ncbi:MAG: SPOR domain-containing protein [Deltaproteobacteria bacterium]|jgi:hypothetical protein|nr:SPOR domain-containing protein [Deltaproteobacteria bacterium]
MSNNAPEALLQKQPRVVTIRLRLPVFITALALFLIGVAWVFFLGVLTGRGYHTEEQIGALAVFMPSRQVAEATGSMNVAGRQNGQGGESGEDDADNLDALFEGSQGSELLRGEDLGFKGSLRGPTEGAPTAGNRTAPASQVDVSPITIPPSGTVGGEVMVASPSEPLYEYVYQVSALNQQHQAQALRQRLTDAGIAAQIELHKTETNTWYRVLVSFRGKNSELPAFINRLEQLNLKQPLLRKKQAVSG